MHDVLQSTNFQDLETHQHLNFLDIINKKRENEGLKAKTEGLPRALAKTIAEQVAQLNPQIATDLELTDQIELILRHDGAFETEALKTD